MRSISLLVLLAVFHITNCGLITVPIKKNIPELETNGPVTDTQAIDHLVNYS